ncbi:MAG: hypothetical protein ACOC80_07610 [Petrotogales bacterium]
MGDFGLLVKYRLKNTSINRNKKFRKLPILYLIIILAIFCLAFLPTIDFFKELDRITLFGDESFITLADAYFSFFSLILLILAILNQIPFFIYNLYDEDEIGFLLKFPISRSSIFFYKFFEAFLGTFVSFALYFSVAFVYGLSKGDIHALLATVAATLGFVFAMGLSVPISKLIGNFVSRTSAKKLSGFLTLLNAGVFLLMISLLGSANIGNEGIFLTVSKSRFLPSTWIMFAAKGGLIEWLLLAVFDLWLIRMSIRVANTFIFEPSARGEEKKVPEKKVISVVKKEFLLLFRGENAVFFLLYPVLFSSIILVITRQFLSAIIVMLLISTLYTSQMVLLMLSAEFLAWPLTAYLPINFRRTLNNKCFIIAIVYTFLFTGILIAAIFVTDVSSNHFFIIPGAFFTFLISSKLGSVFYFASNAHKSGVNKKRLGFSSTLLLEIISFVIGFGNIVVLTLFINSLENTDLLIFKENIVLSCLLGIGIPVITSSVSLIVTERILNKQIIRIKERM